MERKAPCWISGMLESNIGQGPSIALATLPGIAYGADIFPQGRLYETDLADYPIHLCGPGAVTAPDRPGQGFAPDPERLAGCLLKSG